jgi:hypothetical protein
MWHSPRESSALVRCVPGNNRQMSLFVQLENNQEPEDGKHLMLGRLISSFFLYTKSDTDGRTLVFFFFALTTNHRHRSLVKRTGYWFFFLCGELQAMAGGVVY